MQQTLWPVCDLGVAAVQKLANPEAALRVYENADQTWQRSQRHRLPGFRRQERPWKALTQSSMPPHLCKRRDHQALHRNAAYAKQTEVEITTAVVKNKFKREFVLCTTSEKAQKRLHGHRS